MNIKLLACVYFHVCVNVSRFMRINEQKRTWVCQDECFGVCGVSVLSCLYCCGSDGQMWGAGCLSFL